jgi:UDP-N-acetylglucosamine 2-epimerase (non-hydrolysing)
MLVCCIVGARPNFMKMAPVLLELQRREVPLLLVHTGQHYDANMSKVFFDELGMPQPDIHLGVGSDTHARQTARVMEGFERVCCEFRPDLVVAGGDVNSTAAAAMVTAKEGVALAHVESGLRSFDRSMPEEINRVVTDHLSDLLFTTEESANENLRREGIPGGRVHFVGNCMVDTLLRHVEEARGRHPWEEFKLEPRGYALLTLHRPSNVDDSGTMSSLMSVVQGLAQSLPVLFPVHPRTAQRIGPLGLRLNGRLQLCQPLPYLTFLGLMAGARMVLTDSGGIQEETTALGIPCLTLRENTERPVTLTTGTNRLVGRDPRTILEAAQEVLAGDCKAGARPPLWDGLAGVRIVDVLERWFGAKLTEKAS